MPISSDSNLRKIYIRDYKSPQAAVDYAKSIGGARIIFPNGDYPCSLVINSPNIELFSDGNTILRAAGSSTVVDVKAGGINFVLDGFDVRGQTSRNESKSNVNGNKSNTDALHCIRIQERGARLRNFKTRGARYDGIYLKYNGQIDFEAEDFLCDSTARNPVSIIAGQGFKFTRGRVRLDNNFTAGQGKLRSGIYLFDCEPNNINDKYRDIKFKDVVFENAGKRYGNNQVIFQDTNIGNSNDLGVYFEDCEFIKSGTATGSAYVRLKANTKLKEFSNIHFKRTRHQFRAMAIASGREILLKNSTFNDVVIDEQSLTFAIRLSTGTVVSNVRTTADKTAAKSKATSFRTSLNKPVNLLLDKKSNVKVIDVPGY
ncbi:hypothetical protein [Psychrobacter sp. S1-30-MNA-CIBAN-0213]|uniref:hypothetical protein n=1 Tax=unclassified Psychrobacter TaxID=196806 RepID=UPI0033292E99